MNLPGTWEEIGIAVLVFAVSTLVSTGIVGAFLVLIAEDHFVARQTGLGRKFQSPVVQLLWRIGKNVLGVLLVVVGIVLSLPGIPGQGLLTIFVGILLLDIPGKRKIELRIVRRPRIRRTIDRLRERFGRAPLDLEGFSELPSSPRDSTP